MFWMLTMWAYLGYTKRPGVKRYLLILLFFALGLMAKPMLVTLPFVLLLLDYWPLGRIWLGQSGIEHPVANQANIAAKKPRTQVFRLLLGKTPLFALAAVSSVVTFVVQKSGGAVKALEAYPFNIRITNAMVSYFRYISKAIWPQKLAILYPHPGQSLPMWHAALAGLLLVVISTVVIRAGRRCPYLPVGWLWYVGTLVPVIGLVQVGEQAMADRYTYVSLIGLFIIIAWGVPDLTAKYHYGKSALALAAASLLVALMVCSSLQVKHWKNSVTLFEHTVSVTANNPTAHYNLSLALGKKGMLQESMKHSYETLRIRPNYADAHNNLGVALTKQGRLQEAVFHFTEALRINPEYGKARRNLDKVLLIKRK